VSITGVGYAYDGRNYRITRTVSGTTRHFYYTKRWQIIEERVGSSTSADRQFVWGLRYIDDLVCRDVSSTRLYALQDANWNVTTVANTSGAVQQRYRYSPYGVPTVLNPDFSVWTGTDSIGFEYLYCGYRYDADVGLYYIRRRYYSPVVACWLTPDPLGYADDMNVRSYVRAMPIIYVDPSGLVSAQYQVFELDLNGGNTPDTVTGIVTVTLKIDTTDCQTGCDNECSGQAKATITYESMATTNNVQNAAPEWQQQPNNNPPTRYVMNLGRAPNPASWTPLTWNPPAGAPPLGDPNRYATTQGTTITGSIAVGSFDCNGADINDIVPLLAVIDSRRQLANLYNIQYSAKISKCV
jgi:RHS repeat-associated protein